MLGIDRRAQERAGYPPVRSGNIQMCLDRTGDAPLEIPPTRKHPPDPRRLLIMRARIELEDQVFLRFEVVVGRPRRQACPFGDLPHRGLLVSVPHEQRQRRIQYSPSGLARLQIRSTRSQCWRHGMPQNGTSFWSMAIPFRARIMRAILSAPASTTNAIAPTKPPTRSAIAPPTIATGTTNTIESARFDSAASTFRSRRFPPRTAEPYATSRAQKKSAPAMPRCSMATVSAPRQRIPFSLSARTRKRNLRPTQCNIAHRIPKIAKPVAVPSP